MNIVRHFWRQRASIAFGATLGAALAMGFPASAAPPVQRVVPPPQNLPGVRVTLSHPVYVITVDPHTGEPRMPRDVIVSADVVNWPVSLPKPTSFVWRASIDWDFAPYPTHHSIGQRAFNHTSPLALDFGREIRGGTLTIYAKTFWNGIPVFGMAQAQVLGQNPSRSAIFRALPPSRFGLIASKVATVESGLRQFAGMPGQPGWPVLSRTNDVGLMQINAPSGAITSADQVWDWRANLQRGLEMLAGKRRTTVLASRHATTSRRDIGPIDNNDLTTGAINVYRSLIGLTPLNQPVPPPLSYASGSGILPGEPDPDHIALNQFEREMLRRYNGGREYAWLITPDPNTLTLRNSGWTVDPTRGGLRARSGDVNYVFHVLTARSGYVIPKPPKKVAKRARGSHRRHSRRHHR